MTYEEDIENQSESFHQKSLEKEIDNTIKNYFNYLESSNEIKNKTLDEKSTEIYYSILLIQNHLSSYSSFLDSKFETLDNVLFEVNEDIEISFFLTLHGKYRPAKALLRRWLETTIYAIYFDWQIKTNSKTPAKYEKSIENGWEWLTKTSYSRFKGKGSWLDNLIDSHTDSIAKQLLKEKPYFKHASFRGYIETLHSHLSKSVHFGGIDTDFSLDKLNKLSIEFAEYNGELFDEWYMYLNQINEICIIFIFIKFPEMLTLYKEHKIGIPVLETSQMILLEQLLRNK